jgi:hypothetical protein
MHYALRCTPEVIGVEVDMTAFHALLHRKRIWLVLSKETADTCLLFSWEGVTQEYHFLCRKRYPTSDWQAAKKLRHKLLHAPTSPLHSSRVEHNHH